jgi:NAD(P)-dependent dehydrogenase (short-subunit alcohol dehydrogenase family)
MSQVSAVERRCDEANIGCRAFSCEPPHTCPAPDPNWSVTSNECKNIRAPGANKGLGREIARQLAARGIVVWVGARDARRGEEAAAALRAGSGDARFVRLDVTDFGSVRQAAADIAGATDRLDILVNNAGVALDQGAPPSRLDLDRMKAIYDVNVFGAVRVTQAFLPQLRASPAGRIVMISSGLGSLTLQADRASPFFAFNPLGYNSSKTALNAVTLAFAKELSDTAVKVNAADPGYTATDLNHHRGPRSVEQGAAIAVKLATLQADGPTGGFFNDDGPQPW